MSKPNSPPGYHQATQCPPPPPHHHYAPPPNPCAPPVAAPYPHGHHHHHHYEPVPPMCHGAESQPLVHRQIVVANTLTEHPQILFCPRCNRMTNSVTESESGLCTYVCCWSLFLVGCAGGCCLIPFCMDSMKDVVHRCSSCGDTLGVYKRL
jgi:lipopolysaccharide-induced tumor necrosis factor-alpha factor